MALISLSRGRFAHKSNECALKLLHMATQSITGAYAVAHTVDLRMITPGHAGNNSRVLILVHSLPTHSAEYIMSSAPASRKYSVQNVRKLFHVFGLSPAGDAPIT